MIFSNVETKDDTVKNCLNGVAKETKAYLTAFMRE